MQRPPNLAIAVFDNGCYGETVRGGIFLKTRFHLALGVED